MWLSGLTLFIIYLITLAPSVVQIDAGELAAVQATLGIAHPTGYPLFTLIGYLFSKLPLPFSTILQLNILASIWCASAVVIFILAIKNIKTTEIQNLSSKPEKKSRKKNNSSKRKFQSSNSGNNKNCSTDFCRLCCWFKQNILGPKYLC